MANSLGGQSINNYAGGAGGGPLTDLSVSLRPSLKQSHSAQVPSSQSTHLMSLFYPIGGFDIMRLHYPSVDQLNEDFICGLCKKIVLNPLQCSNQQCSALYCKTCLDNNEKQSGGVSKCKLCAKVYPGKQQREAAFMQPSKLILKMLDDYQIQCQHCKRPFPKRDVINHETYQCKNTICANELCGISLDSIPQENLVKFTLMIPSQQQSLDQQISSLQGDVIENKIACSKKCKKVAKFGFVLKQASENEVLKAFETMMKKKMNKRPTNNQTLNAFGGGFGRLSIGASVNQRLITQRQSMHQTLVAKGQEQQQIKRGRGTSQKSRTGNSHSISATSRTLPVGGAGVDFREENKQGDQVDLLQNIQHVQLMNCLLNSSDAFHDFSWDPEHSSKEIHFSKDCRHAFLSESNYYFRTIISNRPFSDGVHYWEIVADARTEHELKVGVTTQQQFNVNSSFSDYEFGFAYYGLGQLRHNSNSLGIPYEFEFNSRRKGSQGFASI